MSPPIQFCWHTTEETITTLLEPQVKFFRAIFCLLKPLQNKKGQKNLGYSKKKQSFYKEKDCFFFGYPNFFLALLILKQLQLYSFIFVQHRHGLKKSVAQVSKNGCQCTYMHFSSSFFYINPKVCKRLPKSCSWKNESLKCKKILSNCSIQLKN